ncbi:MAG: replication factor C large subunit [Candidatus Aenigmatarchaeota archaeon]
MWTEKHKPNSVKEIIEQDIGAFLNAIKNWSPGKKPILISGPPGVGKTSIVYAYAKENNLDLIEINASDNRTPQQIKQIIGNSLMQMSLSKKGKIFLIDEIDGLSKEDKNAASELIDIAKKSKYPIIFTANDPWNPKIARIRENSEHIKFKKISFWNILKALKEICGKEQIDHDDEVLKYIAKISDGDLRSAIKDLETISFGKKNISKKDILEIGIRERKTEVFEAIKTVFKTKSAQGSKNAINNVDKDIEEIFWWIEQNIPNEYESIHEIAKAYKFLSDADIFLSRAKRNQDYKLVRYYIDLMTAGVSLSKKAQYTKFAKYEYPYMIKFLGQNKQNIKRFKDDLTEAAKQLHCSRRKVKIFYKPYFPKAISV